jgi:hypothetical protein
MLADFNCCPIPKDWHKGAFKFPKTEPVAGCSPGCSEEEKVSRLNLAKTFHGRDVWDWVT